MRRRPAAAPILGRMRSGRNPPEMMKNIHNRSIDRRAESEAGDEQCWGWGLGWLGWWSVSVSVLLVGLGSTRQQAAAAAAAEQPSSRPLPFADKNKAFNSPLVRLIPMIDARILPQSQH